MIECSSNCEAAHDVSVAYCRVAIGSHRDKTLSHASATIE
jgi:hypothetical protein